MTIKDTEHQPDAAAFRESFEAFYTREIKAVIGLAYVLSGSRLGAEDLAQEGFLAAYRHWDRISRYDDPGAWVRRVVANRAVSGFRRRKAEAKALVRLRTPHHYVPEIPAESDALWQEVRRLPLRQRQAIALRYLDSLKTDEIAQILECSENTVKTHLRRGTERLASKFTTGREDWT